MLENKNIVKIKHYSRYMNFFSIVIKSKIFEFR